MVSLTGHEAGNGGYSQGLTYSPSCFPLLGANKLARVAWEVLAKNEPYRPPVLADVAAA